MQMNELSNDVVPAVMDTAALRLEWALVRATDAHEVLERAFSASMTADRSPRLWRLLNAAEELVGLPTTLVDHDAIRLDVEGGEDSRALILDNLCRAKYAVESAMEILQDDEFFEDDHRALLRAATALLEGVPQAFDAVSEFVQLGRLPASGAVGKLAAGESGGDDHA